MIYRVILTTNGKYKKTLHKCKTKETSFMKYHSLINENQLVKFPKKYVNTKRIKRVNFKICVVKPTESTDVFRTIRDNFGKLYVENPIGDWTILASEDYQIEEKFWLFGNNQYSDRPTIDEIFKRLMSGAFKHKMVKQVIVVHNKLIIYNEDQFDMVICKCLGDAQRLHHTLQKLSKKQKVKSLMFMGTATPATIGVMYDIIQGKTGWPITKIRRTTTRP